MSLSHSERNAHFAGVFPLFDFKSFRSEAGEWKHFVGALLLIIGIPLFLLFGALEIISWRLGDTVPPQMAAELQSKEPTLAWRGYRDNRYAQFKLARVNILKPDILVMGHSRIAGFRAVMFQPYSFYNMSRVSWPWKTYTDLLRHLPVGYKPKVIVFNLDFFMFNADYGTTYESMKPVFQSSLLIDHLRALLYVFSEIGKTPSLIWADDKDPYYKLPVLGVQGHVYSSGFRPDGSERIPGYFQDRAGRDPGIMSKIDLKNPSYLGGDAMAPTEIKNFEEFVSLAHSKGITLIGVQLPMYRPMIQFLEQSPRHGILKDYRKHAAAGYFDRLGVIYFDFMDFGSYSDDYRYFLDPIHSGQPVGLAVLLKMYADPRVKALWPDLDTASLTHKLEDNSNASQHIEIYNQ